MKDQFEEYIALLETLKEELDRLAALARKKNEAVCGDDLMALDGVMRQEQAIALQFRGLEQKRGQLLAALGLSAVPLSDLREVEHVLDMLGGAQEDISGPGYAPPEAEPPQTMKTDFRA